MTILEKKKNHSVQLSTLSISCPLQKTTKMAVMQSRNEIHLVYTGNDQQVIRVNSDKTAIERVFASELVHNIEICRYIQKEEIIYFEVTIYGKNTREGDFKLIIDTVKSKKSEKKNDKNSSDGSHVIEPPCAWAGNPQRGIFRFMVKLENGEF